MLRRGMLVALFAVGGMVATGCDDDEETTPMVDAGIDASIGIDAAGGSPPVGDAGVVDGGGDAMVAMGCPTHPLVTQIQPGVCAVANTTLAAPMTQSLTMTPANQWLLQGSLIVGNDTAAGAATLTVLPGTVVQGGQTNSAIVIQRYSKIMAEGTATQPIVFTSAQPVGMRAALDWGGVIINGRAPINNPETGDAQGEGVPALYGGNDPADNSGVLKYVRIEFAGGKISGTNEFNGLALQGVGSGTVIDYLQTHMTEDDGIEFFGGSVNAKHLVVTGANDDLLDWTDGWKGKVQFAFLQKLANSGPQSSDPRGIEADNREGAPTRMPMSSPILSNITLVNGRTDVGDGIRLRRGTAGQVWNTVVKGFPTCLYVDAAAGANVGAGTLVVQNLVLDCATATGQDAMDTSATALIMGKTVVTSMAGIGADGRPMAGSPALNIGATSTDPFFTPTTYAGAFDGTTDWTMGWTQTAAN